MPSSWDSQESCVANHQDLTLPWQLCICRPWHLCSVQQVSNITSNWNRWFWMWHLVTGSYKFHPHHCRNESNAVRPKMDVWVRGWLVCLTHFPFLVLESGFQKEQCSQSFDWNRKEIKIICVDLTLKVQLATISVLPPAKQTTNTPPTPEIYTAYVLLWMKSDLTEVVVCMAINHWECVTVHPEQTMCRTYVVCFGEPGWRRWSSCSDLDGGPVMCSWSCLHKTAAWPHMWSRIFCLSRADKSNAFQRLDGPKLPWTQTFIPVWTAPLYSQWTLERREASLCLSQQDLIYLYISLFVFGWLIYQWVSCALISFQTFPFYFWLWVGNRAIRFCASSLFIFLCYWYSNLKRIKIIFLIPAQIQFWCS